MQVLKGIALKLMATLAVVLMFASIRALYGRLPTGEVVFFRSLFALAPLVLWYGVQGRLRDMTRTRSVWLHFGRGLTGTGGMFFNYMALSWLTLAQLTAFTYAVPIFTVIFAALLLGEAVGYFRWGAVVVGFGGVLVMLIPAFATGSAQSPAETDAFVAGAAAALFAAACSALSFIQIRRMTLREDPAAIVFWFTVLTTVLGLCSLPLGWKMPRIDEMLLLLASGIFGLLAQVLMVLALRVAKASVLAPFEYAGMLWALLVSHAVFGASTDVYTVAGAVIVAGAGLFTLWREHRLATVRRDERDGG